MFLLCLKVFFGKLIDVTLSTMQTMHVISNKRIMASILGFIDVFIWFLVVKEALKTESNSLIIPLMYALGFAFGTLIGTRISNKIIKRIISINVITTNKKLCNIIINAGFGGTIINSRGIKDNKNSYLIISQIESRNIKRFEDIIKNNDKNAIIIMSESKNIINGFF